MTPFRKHRSTHIKTQSALDWHSPDFEQRNDAQHAQGDLTWCQPH